MLKVFLTGPEFWNLAPKWHFNSCSFQPDLLRYVSFETISEYIQDFRDIFGLLIHGLLISEWCEWRPYLWLPYPCMEGISCERELTLTSLHVKKYSLLFMWKNYSHFTMTAHGVCIVPVMKPRVCVIFIRLPVLGFKGNLKWHISVWFSYRLSPVLGLRKRSHKQPTPCPLHGHLT